MGGVGIPTIGKPIRDIAGYILDERLKPTPIGVFGQLYIGGKGVTQGYHARPDLTAAVFLPDPFTTQAGSRMYNTGDVVRLLPNGEIEYHGRLDGQVKLRGLRIELGEIETVLGQIEGVQEALVLAPTLAHGDAELVAYLVTASGFSLDSAKHTLSQTLPAYMTPRYYVQLAAMPLTPNGKIDRRALPIPELGQSDPQEQIAPRNALENTLFAIWQRVLGHSNFGVNGNFFDNGGHSLIAVQLMAQIKKELAVELSLASLFHAPSIEEQAVLVAQAQTGSTPRPHSNLIPMAAPGMQGTLFCVHPVGGYTFAYQALAQYLAPDFSVVGIQAVGLEDGAEPFHDVQEAARHYVELIRSYQPQGPYALAGWSMGGSVAHEMACQLLDAGQQITLVALFDTYAHPTTLALPDAQDWPALLYSFAQDMAADTGLALPFGIAQLQALPDGDAQLAWALQQMRAQGLIGPEVSHQKALRILEVYQANLLALGKWHPRSQAMNLLLFRAADDSQAKREASLGWAELMAGGQAKVQAAQGSHRTLLNEPQVSHLARELKQELKQALNNVVISKRV